MRESGGNHRISTEEKKKEPPIAIPTEGNVLMPIFKSVSRQLEKLAPPDKEKLIVEKAIMELQEGASSLAERQNSSNLRTKQWDVLQSMYGRIQLCR